MTAKNFADLNFDDWPVPNDYLVEIGRLALLWARLETYIGTTIAVLAGHGDLTDARAYIQLAANPAGALMDAWIKEPRGALDLSYDSGAEIQTHVGTDHWAVEMRIPLERIPAETVTGSWRLHIARARRTTGEYLTCLQTPVAGFHEIASFAQVEGIEKLRIPFALRGFSTGTLGYGRNECRFEVAGRKASLTGARIEVGGSIRAQFDSAALQIMTGEMKLPFALTPEDRNLILTLQTFTADRIVQRRDIALTSLPETLLTGPDRSVFFLYHNAPVVLDLPLHMDPGEQDLRLVWTARNSDGRELGAGLTSPVPPRARLRLYWQDWRAGNVNLEWRLILGDQELEHGSRTLRLVENPWRAGQ